MITKYIYSGILVSGLIGFAGVSNAQEVAALIVSNNGSEPSIEFAQGPTEITGVQFDVFVKGGKGAASDFADACLIDLPDTHQAFCGRQDSGAIRVLVFSASNAALETGKLGTIDGAAQLQILPNSVLASDARANHVKLEAISQPRHGYRNKMPRAEIQKPKP